MAWCVAGRWGVRSNIVQVFEIQAARRPSAPMGDEQEEELEGIAVSRNGGRTGAALGSEAVPEIALEQLRESVSVQILHGQTRARETLL
jgi:hypothetical protein